MCACAEVGVGKRESVMDNGDDARRGRERKRDWVDGGCGWTVGMRGLDRSQTRRWIG